MDCGVYATSCIRMGGGDDAGYSHESEHDLAVMVTDFLENGSGDSHRYLNSSDSDSGFSDLPSLADNIKVRFSDNFIHLSRLKNYSFDEIIYLSRCA